MWRKQQLCRAKMPASFQPQHIPAAPALVGPAPAGTAQPSTGHTCVLAPTQGHSQGLLNPVPPLCPQQMHSKHGTGEGSIPQPQESPVLPGRAGCWQKPPLLIPSHLCHHPGQPQGTWRLCQSLPPVLMAWPDAVIHQEPPRSCKHCRTAPAPAPVLPPAPGQFSKHQRIPAHG